MEIANESFIMLNNRNLKHLLGEQGVVLRKFKTLRLRCTEQTVSHWLKQVMLDDQRQRSGTNHHANRELVLFSQILPPILAQMLRRKS